MKILRGILESTPEGPSSVAQVFAEIIETRLEEMGIRLREAQREELRAKLTEKGVKNLERVFDDGQVPSELLSEACIQKEELTLDHSDCEHLVDDVLEQFDEREWAKHIRELVPRISEPLLRSYKRRSRRMLRARRKDRKAFESKLARHWRKALGLLEQVIVIAAEAGEEFNEEFWVEASKEKDYVFDVLTRLYARACRVALEVLTLLRSGFADGAHARWRTLHEIAVVACFVADSGRDVAERYLLHEAIEGYRGALEYQSKCERIGYEPLTEEELEALTTRRNSLIKRFGKDYGDPYGWAAKAVGKKKGKVTFRDIEDSVELDHLRPYYRMASHNVHANPKGVYSILGLPSEGPEILLAGPSNVGLSDPGQGTAISLGQVTAALLLRRPNLERLVICDLFKRVRDEAEEAFSIAHEELEQ